MRLILFDVDGTLVDSAALIHAAMRAAFREHGQAEPDLAQTRAVIGLTLDRAIADIMRREPDALSTAMAATYKRHYLALISQPRHVSALFDGMEDLVRALAAEPETLLGIVTGKSRAGLRRLVENHRLDHMFVVARTADDCPSKPHPAMVSECCAQAGIAPGNAVVVGDTVYDVQMAAAAGAASVAVTWGNHDAGMLRAARPDALVHTAGELRELFSAPGRLRPRQLETPNA